MCKSPLIFVLLVNQRQLLILELHERNVHMTADQKSLPEDEKTSFMQLFKNNNNTIISTNSHYSWPRHDSSCQCLQDYTSANTTDNITNYATTLLIQVKKIPIKMKNNEKAFTLCIHCYLTSWYVNCWTLRIIKSVHRSQAEHG